MVWSSDIECGPFCDPTIMCRPLPYPFPRCVCQETFILDDTGSCISEALCENLVGPETANNGLFAHMMNA